MKEKHQKNNDSQNLFKALAKLTKTVGGLARGQAELAKTVDGLALATAKRFDAHDSAFQTMMREIRLIREDTRDIKMSMSPLNNIVASHDREIRDLHTRVLHLERKTISGK